MRVKCPLCDFETDDAAVLTGHILSSHTEPGSTKFSSGEKEVTKYECQYCGAVFDTYQEAVEHVSRVHMEELKKEVEKQEKEEKPKKKSKKSKAE